MVPLDIEGSSEARTERRPCHREVILALIVVLGAVPLMIYSFSKGAEAADNKGESTVRTTSDQKSKAKQEKQATPSVANLNKALIEIGQAKEADLKEFNEEKAKMEEKIKALEEQQVNLEAKTAKLEKEKAKMEEKNKAPDEQKVNLWRECEPGDEVVIHHPVGKFEKSASFENGRHAILKTFHADGGVWHLVEVGSSGQEIPNPRRDETYYIEPKSLWRQAGEPSSSCQTRADRLKEEKILQEKETRRQQAHLAGLRAREAEEKRRASMTPEERRKEMLDKDAYDEKRAEEKRNNLNNIFARY